MGRALLIIACGILVGLLVVWMVLGQVPSGPVELRPPNDRPRIPAGTPLENR